MEPNTHHVVVSSNSYDRIIIVGDVHGCLVELRALLQDLSVTSRDLLIFVGDIIAKGPMSVETIREVMALKALCVRGNHEDNLVKSLKDPQSKHHRSGVYSFGEELTEQEIQWVTNLPYTISLPDAGLVIVHAGLVPHLALEQQKPKDMIRMRTLDKRGVASKERASAELTPWAPLYPGPFTVVFGHNAKEGLQVHAFAVGLDTGCVYGRKLTALVVDKEGRRFVNVKAERVYEERE